MTEGHEDHEAHGSMSRSVALPVGRIRPAYEQVADQLQVLIVNGTLKEGDRLPPLPELATMFGVGRSTAREALRLLGSQNLVSAVRGSTGGTFVTISDPGSIGKYLETSIGLLSGNSRISSEELLEARRILEVPATRAAAERRTEEQVEGLDEAIAFERQLLEMGERGRRFDQQLGFHNLILDASGNRLIQVMTRPIFRVIQSRFYTQVQSAGIWKKIDREHVGILTAIREKDAERAAKEMEAHLLHLSTVYTSLGNS
jgi:GntR family transcriptional regulator, transcriptional repressor for pyruvate dehydrogenase complex